MTLSIAKPANHSNAYGIGGHPDDRKRSYAATTTVLDVPNLIQVQLDSFAWFKSEGLKTFSTRFRP